MSLSYDRRKSWGFGSGGGGAVQGSVDFISSSSVAYGTRTDTLIPAPAGITDDDHLLIIFEIGLGGGLPPPPATPPAGFVIAVGFPVSRNDGAGFTVDSYVWEKTAAAEAGNYNVVHLNANTNAYMQCAREQDLVTPLNPAPTVNIGTGATSTALGLTTVRNNSLIVYYCSRWNFPGINPPGGATPTFTTRLDGTVTLLFVSTGVLGSAGPTGNKIATGLPNTPTEPWASGLIAIRP
jgi:hypothetical protein